MTEEPAMRDAAFGHLRLLRRVPAAHYVSQRYFPCSPKTLAKLAVVGGGPAFRKCGKWPMYAEADLDKWALAKIGPLVRSTSEIADQPAPRSNASTR